MLFLMFFVTGWITARHGLDVASALVDVARCGTLT